MKNDYLICIDCQNDFIDGALPAEGALEAVPKIVDLIKSWEGPILATKDTHNDDYLETQEGKVLPVIHCIENSNGWKINNDIVQVLFLHQPRPNTLNKHSFGSLSIESGIYNPNTITLVGFCTDICVISNALILKAKFPETPIYVLSPYCAGTTKENHQKALDVMKMCQVNIINDISEIK